MCRREARLLPPPTFPTYAAAVVARKQIEPHRRRILWQFRQTLLAVLAKFVTIRRMARLDSRQLGCVMSDAKIAKSILLTPALHQHVRRLTLLKVKTQEGVFVSYYRTKVHFRQANLVRVSKPFAVINNHQLAMIRVIVSIKFGSFVAHSSEVISDICCLNSIFSL